MIRIKTFSITDAFSFGLKQYGNNFVTFLVPSLLIMACALLLSLTGFGLFGLSLFTATDVIKPPFSIYTFVPLSAGLSAIFFILSLLFWFFYEYQVIRAGIALYHGKTITTNDFFSFEPERFIKYVGARLLMGCKAALGIFLFVVGAFYFATKYYFAGYSIADEKTVGVHSDSVFARMLTQGIKWWVFLFYIIAGILTNIAYQSLVGILFLPIVILSQVHVYKQLAEFVEDGQEKPIELERDEV